MNLLTKESLLAFECDAGGTNICEQMVRETLKGAMNLRQVPDALAAGWEWRMSRDIWEAYQNSGAHIEYTVLDNSKFDPSKPPRNTLLLLPVQVERQAKNSIYLVDKHGMIAGQIIHLAIPEAHHVNR